MGPEEAPDHLPLKCVLFITHLSGCSTRQMHSFLLCLMWCFILCLYFWPQLTFFPLHPPSLCPAPIHIVLRWHILEHVTPLFTHHGSSRFLLLPPFPGTLLSFLQLSSTSVCVCVCVHGPFPVGDRRVHGCARCNGRQWPWGSVFVWRAWLLSYLPKS